MADLWRKKPVVVQANELTRDNAESVAVWCGGVLVEEVNAENPLDKYVGINIPTLEGIMRASEGDYVIKGVQGEFYPCKPGIFTSTYEKVE